MNQTEPEKVTYVFDFVYKFIMIVKCTEYFELSEMEADHITPWHEGGKTTEDNCQLLCKKDNRIKSGK